MRQMRKVAKPVLLGKGLLRKVKSAAPIRAYAIRRLVPIGIKGENHTPQCTMQSLYASRSLSSGQAGTVWSTPICSSLPCYGLSRPHSD